MAWLLAVLRLTALHPPPRLYTRPSLPAARRPPSPRASSPPPLLSAAALAGLTDQEAAVALWLASPPLRQPHLFASWHAAPADAKRRLLRQALELDARYASREGGAEGLEAYVARARRLLSAEGAARHPFEGVGVGLAEGERLAVGSEGFLSDERLGMSVVQDAVFVLVAGGLGERLGFDGIKVELPADTLSAASFLETYCRSLLAMERAAGGRRSLPLVIMSSEDTHAKTVALLEAHRRFGLGAEQLFFVTQSSVPALVDSDARFALGADGFSLQTKPHGHGDVHTLLHQAGLLARFVGEGRKYVVFFQDTNVLAFKAIPAALGVSVRKSLTMNSIAVPRYAGEEAGAICKLLRPDAPPLVINVEYNQLDALLKASGAPGDEADSSGYSPYPGNTNTFVLDLPAYAAALEASGGAMPEFVNPKYADASRRTFKKPTRLECMMQDIPKLLAPDARVGFTQLERWFSFSPIKNSIDAAIEAHRRGVYPASPGAAEAMVYAANVRLLQLAGVRVETSDEPQSFLGLPLVLTPAVSLSPAFALTVGELQRKLPGAEAISVSRRSALLLDGDVTIQSLTLDGALFVRLADGVRLLVHDCTIRNAGCGMKALADDVEAEAVPPAIAIRGYRLETQEAANITISIPGEYELVGEGELRKLA